MADNEEPFGELSAREIEKANVEDVEIPDIHDGQSFDPAVLIPVSELAEFLRTTAQKIHPRKSKRYPHPFFIDEQLIGKLDSRVRNAMAEVAVDQVSIGIQVRYADLSSETYRDLQQCFDSAGDDADAESIELIWSGLAVNGNFHTIEIVCVTEKPLASSATRAPVPEAAGITLSVSGESRRWVRITFSQLESLINATRLSMLFRPLEVFRHTVFIQIGSWIVGAVMWYISYHFMVERLEKADNQRRMQEILASRSLDGRFEAFVRDILSPHNSFLLGLFLFLIPYGLLFLGFILGERYLSHLVPRSSVSIGLSSRRYHDYINVFKFVIFTVALGSILGVIVNLISGLL